MTETHHDIVQRAPQEIWWKILDEVIRVPLVFDTIYEGDSWVIDATNRMELKEDELYEASEKQRKIIGSVCRSWQIFAQARSGRRVLLLPRTWDKEKDRLLRACSVKIRMWPGIVKRLPPVVAQGVNWKILELEIEGAAKFCTLASHPHLRGLKLMITGFGHSGQRVKFPLARFSKSFKKLLKEVLKTSSQKDGTRQSSNPTYAERKRKNTLRKCGAK
jgi:hypothetical protein